LLFNSKFNNGANQIFLDIAKNVNPDVPLIVNCKRVTNFDESVYRIIKENNLTRKIIFTNVEEGFHGQFANELETILGLSIVLCKWFWFPVFNSLAFCLQKEWKSDSWQLSSL
jgi:hypothetical protein